MGPQSLRTFLKLMKIFCRFSTCLCSNARRAWEYRAAEHSLISLQIFLWGWCFNFQSVWVNNVWLSVPLLTLTIFCLNPIVPRAWGLGSLTGVLIWGFLCLHNRASQYLSRISEFCTKLIYQALWTNEDLKEGSVEASTAFTFHWIHRFSFAPHRDLSTAE